MRRIKLCACILAAIASLACLNRDIMRSSGTQTNANEEVPVLTESTGAPYLATHQVVVDEMLSVAKVGGDDILYDLGSGDGRIPITAAMRFGTRGVGIDIDPVLVKMASKNAIDQKVADKVKFIEADIFKYDFSDATVVMLYLSPDLNVQLKPQLMKLRSGTRIVSHNHDMGDWKPDVTRKVTTPGGVEHRVYLWRIP